MNLLCNELTACYQACVTGSEPPPLSQLGTFADYALKEQSEQGVESRERAVAYWRSVLANGIRETNLPLEPPEAAVADGEVARAQLKQDEVHALRGLAERARCTPFVVLLAAYFVFLHRLTGQERVTVGSFFANRSDPRFVNVCGLLFNDLPITVECSPESTFEEFVLRVRDEFVDLLPHAMTPVDRTLVAEASRGTAQILYEQHNVTCQLYESPPNRLRLDGCEVQQKRFFYGSKYDLMLYGSLADDRLDLWFNCRRDKFKDRLVASWLDSFGRLLGELVRATSVPIAEIDLDPASLDRARWARDDIRDRCRDAVGIIAHLDESAVKHRRRIAVAGPCEGDWLELTYGTLTAWAQRTAHELEARGVREGDRVAVYCTRGRRARCGAPRCPACWRRVRASEPRLSEGTAALHRQGLGRKGCDYRHRRRCRVRRNRRARPWSAAHHPRRHATRGAGNVSRRPGLPHLHVGDHWSAQGCPAVAPRRREPGTPPQGASLRDEGEHVLHQPLDRIRHAPVADAHATLRRRSPPRLPR